MKTVQLEDGGQIMKQASDTANEYLIRAIDSIDKQFGEGYSKKHPELVAKVIEVASRDFHTTMMNITFGDIAEALNKISEAMSDK
jgi:hypothetical protein